MSGSEMNTIGYACSYVPAEIIHAAGFRPERIIPRAGCSDADGFSHPNLCCYARSLLADAVNGSWSRMEAVILANSCDGMRRVFDLWGGYVDRPGAIFLDIPKKQDKGAAECFSASLKRLGSYLSGLPGGRPVTESRLREAARVMNRVRSGYRALFEAQRKGLVKGSEVFSVLEEDSPTPSEMIPGMLQRHFPANRGKRILITGNMLNSPVPVSMIESAGGSVAGFDTCFGLQHAQLPVDGEETDIWMALAQRYLSGPGCPRMMGIQGQLERIKTLAAEVKPDGAVISKIQFCDNLSFNLPLLQETLEASGVKCLVLENDYEWSDEEKMRIRVEAFLEMME